jgi:putative transposase
MTKRKYTDAEVIGALKHLEAGRNPADLGREMGVSKHTFYACEASFGGLELNQARRLRQLEEERSLSSLRYQTPAKFAGQLAASSERSGTWVRLRPAPWDSAARRSPPRGDQCRMIHTADSGAGQSPQYPRHHSRRHHLQCGSS